MKVLVYCYSAILIYLANIRQESKGRDGKSARFEPHSSRHVGTLGKVFTSSCLYNAMWRPAWLPFG